MPDNGPGALTMTFIKESRIAASPERVFAFHESDHALERLTPPWERVTVEKDSQSILPGSRVVIRMKLGPLSLRWVAEHVEYDPPRHFSDRQLSGPFAHWFHRHYFLDDGTGGTTLRDVVEYEPPLGVIGRLMAGRFLRGKLQAMFDYRHETTKSIVESGEFVPKRGSHVST